jgi:predicted nucleic acid-binding protein
MTLSGAFPQSSVVLDTDVFSHLRNKRDYVVREVQSYVERLQKPPALASMTVFEALQGIESETIKGHISVDDALTYKNRISELLRIYPVLPFDSAAAQIAALIFPRLSQSERNKHWGDLFIAATALAHNHAVATQNLRDFERIAQCVPSGYNLRVVGWRA